MRSELRRRFTTFRTWKRERLSNSDFSPAERLCRNAQMPHICHPERSEGSRVFSHIRRRDFSASPRNDSCDTVSDGGRLRWGCESEIRFTPSFVISHQGEGNREY